MPDMLRTLVLSAATLSLAEGVHADFVALEVDLDAFALDGVTPLTDLPGYAGEQVYMVYAVFELPGDECYGVAGMPGSPFHVATEGGSGFVNARAGGDSFPTQKAAAEFPEVHWDSFYTIGLLVEPDEPYDDFIVSPATPGPNTDPWPDDPEVGVNMAWVIPICIAPPGSCPPCAGHHPHGCAGNFEGYRIPLLRLVVAPGETISGSLNVLKATGGKPGIVATSFVATCETAGPDCNGNGLADVCDIESGISTDYDGNGVPDDCECLADLSQPPDGQVSVEDLMLVVLDWGTCGGGGTCPSDVTGDGFVNVDDLVYVVLSWGDCPEP